MDLTEPQATTGTDDAMTRSEQRLVAGTEVYETGRARLRKYVVTEDVQITVQVRREELRLEREPVEGHHAISAKDRRCSPMIKSVP